MGRSTVRETGTQFQHSTIVSSNLFNYLFIILIVDRSSRMIPHDEFQDHLRGRFYLSPSKLYSVIRLLPNKQGYDVPVCGDWLTIAVVAERGQVKYSRAPVGIGRDDGAQEVEKEDSLDNINLDGSANPNPYPRKFQRGPAKKKDEAPKPSGKRYVNLKLIDFGCRSGKSSSATGGLSTIRGDAALSLLLFESEGFDTIEENGRTRKLYKGGSRGAYEKLSRLKEGAVIALLNPKILKPYTVRLFPLPLPPSLTLTRPAALGRRPAPDGQRPRADARVRRVDRARRARARPGHVRRHEARRERVRRVVRQARERGVRLARPACGPAEESREGRVRDWVRASLSLPSSYVRQY